MSPQFSRHILVLTICTSIFVFLSQACQAKSDSDAYSGQYAVRQTAEPDIRDIKGPVRPSGRSFSLAIAVSTGLFIGLYGIRLARRKMRRRMPGTDVREEALDAIRMLAAKGLPEHGRSREHVIELSGIIRGYLHALSSHDISALTTEELLAVISASDGFQEERETNMRDLLLFCDLVKFSGYEPSRHELDLAVMQAIEIIGPDSERGTPGEV